jgi:hypothetical protein
MGVLQGKTPLSLEAIAASAATPEHFDKTFNINARGVYFIVQKA